ncbi:MAG: septal ring lytic transglycosylase RlpA family protein [Thiobacillaceae bacterium]
MLPPLRGGGYYKDDGPGANPPPNLHAVPDAVPRPEPLHRFANNPYRVRGVSYSPMAGDAPHFERGLASWYGRRFHGRPTSSGEPYDMYAMTAAHRTLPIPSYARVTNLENGRSVIVRINDRGPFHPDRVIDLSYTAAYKLDLLKGVGMVEVERLFPDEGDATTSFAAGAGETATPVLVSTQAGAQPTVSVDTVATMQPAGVYLQLGAFGRPESAEALAQRLTQRYGETLPGVWRPREGGLVRVQVGPYANAAEADTAARRLVDDLNVGPYRVVVKSAAAGAPDAPKAAATQWLQLAAYSNRQAAQRLVERLQADTALPGLARIEADGLVKVQAGPFASDEQAERAAQYLTAALGHRPFRVVR